MSQLWQVKNWDIINFYYCIVIINCLLFFIMSHFRPCVELFEEQEESYKESVLPSSVKKRVVVEAAHSFGWHKYTGFDGICITMDRFGASAPGGECMKNFGFTVENVVNKTKEIL